MSKQETKQITAFGNYCIKVNRLYMRGMITCFERVESIMRECAKHRYSKNLLMIAETAITTTKTEPITNYLNEIIENPA